jgi:hypothetical protein
MANFDVTEIIKQVQLLTHHDGLDGYVITWINRTLQDIGTTAIWNRQVVSKWAAHDTATHAYGTNLFNQLLHVEAQDTTVEVIEVVGAQAAQYHTTTPTFFQPMHRRDWHGILGYMNGGNITSNQDANGAFAYAIPFGSVDTATTGGTVYQRMAMYPLPTTTNSFSEAIRYQYLEAPSKMTLGSSTHWIMTHYPKLVLAGVMMRARLYLRDGRGYLVEKAAYTNALADMVLMEENIIANKPYLRAVQSDELNRRL